MPKKKPTAMQTYNLGQLPPGTRFISRGGEEEYLVLNWPSDGESRAYIRVANLKTGVVTSVGSNLQLGVVRNGRLRETGKNHEYTG